MMLHISLRFYFICSTQHAMDMSIGLRKQISFSPSPSRTLRIIEELKGIQSHSCKKNLLGRSACHNNVGGELDMQGRRSAM